MALNCVGGDIFQSLPVSLFRFVSAPPLPHHPSSPALSLSPPPPYLPVYTLLLFCAGLFGPCKSLYLCLPLLILSCLTPPSLALTFLNFSFPAQVSSGLLMYVFWNVYRPSLRLSLSPLPPLGLTFFVTICKSVFLLPSFIVQTYIYLHVSCNFFMHRKRTFFS